MSFSSQWTPQERSKVHHLLLLLTPLFTKCVLQDSSGKKNPLWCHKGHRHHPQPGAGSARLVFVLFPTCRNSSKPIENWKIGVKVGQIRFSLSLLLFVVVYLKTVKSKCCRALFCLMSTVALWMSQGILFPVYDEQLFAWVAAIVFLRVSFKITQRLYSHMAKLSSQTDVFQPAQVFIIQPCHRKWCRRVWWWQWGGWGAVKEKQTPSHTA